MEFPQDLLQYKTKLPSGGSTWFFKLNNFHPSKEPLVFFLSQDMTEFEHGIQVLTWIDFIHRRIPVNYFGPTSWVPSKQKRLKEENHKL